MGPSSILHDVHGFQLDWGGDQGTTPAWLPRMDSLSKSSAGGNNNDWGTSLVPTCEQRILNIYTSSMWLINKHVTQHYTTYSTNTVPVFEENISL